MLETGVASTDEVRDVAARAVGVASDADRIVDVCGAGVFIVAAEELDSVVRVDGVAAEDDEVREAHGRGFAPIAQAEVEARGVGSTLVVLPVKDDRGFGMVLAAAVGVFILEEVPTGAVAAGAVRLRPGVVGPREGRGGTGCVCRVAAVVATRDSLRRAGPETGGRELVNVLLRRLRIGVLISLAASSPDVCVIAADEEVAALCAGDEREDRPADALPERVSPAARSTMGLLAAGTTEARGLSSLDPAVGVTREGRGTIRDTGLVTVEVAAVGPLTVDVTEALARPTVLTGVFAIARLCSCAFLAASAAHFCTFCASLWKSSSSSSSSSLSLLFLLPALVFSTTLCILSTSFFCRPECEIENELFPNSKDASPLSSIRLPAIMLELPMKLPVRLSSIVSSPAAFLTTLPKPSPLSPSALPFTLPKLRGLKSVTPLSSGTTLHLGFALNPPSLAGELRWVTAEDKDAAVAEADWMRALARETSKLSSIVISAAVLAAAAKKLVS